MRLHTFFLSAWLVTGSLMACASSTPPATSAAEPPSTAGSETPASTPQDSPTLGLEHERHAVQGVITGAQPTPEVLAQAKAAGVDTVVRLRTAEEPMQDEEQAEVEALGMRYIWIPVAGAKGLTPEKVRELDQALQGSELALVHCGSGNRAGALMALRAFWLQGKSPEQALQIGRDAGLTSLEPEVEKLLQSTSE